MVDHITKFDRSKSLFRCEECKAKFFTERAAEQHEKQCNVTEARESGAVK